MFNIVIREDTKCDCGDEQVMNHLLIYPNFPTTIDCTTTDLQTMTKDAIEVVKSGKGTFNN